MLRRLEGEQPCSSGLSCCLLCRLSWPHLINWFYKRLWFTPSCFLLIFLFQCWQNVPVIHEINFQHGTSHILWLEYLAFMLIPTTMSFSSSPYSLTPEPTGLLFVAHKLNRRNCLWPDRMHNSWLSLPVSALSAFDSPVREIIVVSVLEQWCPIIGKWVSKLGSINLMKYYIGPE